MYARQNGGSRQVWTPQGPAELIVHLVGPHPILLHFLNRMDLCRTTNSCLGTPRERVLSNGLTLCTLVQNIILSPAPLYRIAEWAHPIDPSALGLSPAEKNSVNDDRVARTLDELATPRARSLFFRLALHIIKQFEIDIARIHHDTTTVTFHGQYKRPHPEPKITYGVNKDHRPDLKQLVFGLNVTGDGAVPISHEVYSGNRTDDTVHRGNVDRLREIIGHEEFIYVADSKLCTAKNLKHISNYGGKFVTVLPRTRSEDKGFRKALRDGARVRWRKLIEMPNTRRKRGPPVVYWTTTDGPNHTKEGYRIVWCRSSQKASNDVGAREAALQKAEAELVTLDTRLNRGRLRQKTAITKAIKATLRAHNCSGLIEVTITKRTRIRTKRMRPGRPKEGDPVKELRIPEYSLRIRRDKGAIHADARCDGVFPLVTNLSGREAPKKEVLLTYKYQPYVEKRHALFKTELSVAPVYLKKPHRAAALVHATFVAMMLDALIERTLRQAMVREGIEQLPILPEGRMTKTPTTARLLEMFSDVSWYEFQRKKECVTFPVKLTGIQKQLLRLLEIDPATYG